MNFSNYQDFRNKVQVMLDGDDISTSDLSVTVLDLIIGAGEQRIYRDLRSSAQDTTFSLTTTSNAITLPTDFIEMRGAPYMATYRMAKYTTLEDIQNMIQACATVTPGAVWYSFSADTIIFYPIQSDGATVTGNYYKRFSDISGGLNALFNRHPDIFLYASLAESGPFLGETTRTPIWDDKYLKLVQAANETERRRYTRGGKLTTRVA